MRSKFSLLFFQVPIIDSMQFANFIKRLYSQRPSFQIVRPSSSEKAYRNLKMHWSIPATELSIVVLIQWFEIDKWCKRGQACNDRAKILSSFGFSIN